MTGVHGSLLELLVLWHLHRTVHADAAVRILESLHLLFLEVSWAVADMCCLDTALLVNDLLHD